MNTTNFATLGALVDHVASLPSVGDRGGDWWNEHAGNVDTAGAMRLARLGWAEGAQKAAAIADRIANRVIDANGASAEQVIGYDVCGAAYDAGAYLSGSPECWATFAPTESKRSVRIVLNATVSCAVSPDTLLNRGIAIAALVLALQSRGYPVTVDVIQALTPRSGHADAYSTVVRVIDANGSPLDVDRLVFAVAHPSMFRHLLRAQAVGRRGALHDKASVRWDGGIPMSDWQPDGEAVDLFIGGILSSHNAERYANGGEDWVLAEFERQTRGQ